MKTKATPQRPVTRRCPDCGALYTDYGPYRELCTCDAYEDDEEMPWVP
jgi:hypothetical protein